MFNTPDGAEFIGINSDREFGLEKAKKGTPEYDKWLEAYRAKRAGKGSSSEKGEKAKKVLEKEHDNYPKLYGNELTPRQKKAWDRAKSFEGQDFSEESWRALRQLSTALDDSIVYNAPEGTKYKDFDRIIFDVGSITLEVSGQSKHGGHDTYIIGENNERDYVSAWGKDVPAKFKGKLSNIRICKINDSKNKQLKSE